MKTYFEQVFGELSALIKSDNLRAKTIDAWVLAAEEGGWTEGKQLEQIPFTLLTETHGLNLIEHTIAVTKGAIGLAKAQFDTYHKMPYKIDMDVLISGGLLHDVGKLLEIEKANNSYRKSRNGKCARHPFSGSIIAAKVGMPDEIINTIACHAKEGDGRPQRVETVLIHQSDFATFNPLVMMQKGILIDNEG
ncbi:MAG: HDIG domain-containing protein [Candidatus Cloacimonetes bacterium]|nr:HDIG domain-containing protein [Candidatus Cloacimonadota bacterium]